MERASDSWVWEGRRSVDTSSTQAATRSKDEAEFECFRLRVEGGECRFDRSDRLVVGLGVFCSIAGESVEVAFS